MSTQRGTHTCMVSLCRSKGTIPGISYFGLTESRYNAWLQALGIDPLIQKVSTHNRVYSVHFAVEDMTVTPRGKTLLKSGAIPKFNLGPNVEIRKSLIEEKSLQTERFIAEEEPALQIEVPAQEGDLDSKSSSTLTCDSVFELWDDNNLFYFLIMLQVCCISLLHKPASFFTETVSPKKCLKRKLSPDNPSFSSLDSIGLHGSPKKRRQDFRTFHNYYLSPRRLFCKQEQALQQKKQLN